jgi:hypothetical protein
MVDINDVASYIWRRSKDYNVNPAMALGIAKSEGLNPNTIGSPTFGNRDNKGYSFGPFQLYSGSSDPTKIAPGGMAYDFQQKYGEAPSAANWQQGVDFSLEQMANKGTGAWYSVRDRGGIGNITKIGEKYASELGLSGDQAAAAPASYTAPWSNAVTAIGDVDKKYLGGSLGVLSSPITGLLGMFGQNPSLPQTAPTPAGGGGRQPDILAPVVGGDARLEKAPDTMSAGQIAGFAGLGNSLIAAGAPKMTWKPSGEAAPAFRGQWRDDIFAGLLGPRSWG